jgi:threonine dehydrogenase-like Zn-dependent dehydrogenase
MLSTYLLRLDGLDVWTAALEPPGGEKAELVAACGARYVPVAETAPAALAAEVGGFDVVIVAAGSAQLSLDSLGLLRRNGVACLLGIDGHDRDVTLPGPVIGVDAVLGNRAVLGSVNANVADWHAAVDGLDAARTRWPDTLDRFVGLRTGLDDYEEAFAFPGVKATLTLQDT